MSNDSAVATPSSPATTRITTLPVLRPVELAACSIGRLDAVVVVGDRPTDGETPARVVVLGDLLRSKVVDDVRGVMVVGDVLRAVVVGDAGGPELLALVVVGRAATLVVVEGGVVVELPRAVVVVGLPTVVLGSASGVVVVGMMKPWRRRAVRRARA